MTDSNPLLVAGLSLEALYKLRDDLRDQNRAHLRASKIVSGHIIPVHEAIRIKEAQENPEEIIVTDHAIVRWLERIVGMDLEPVREEIRRIINEHAFDPSQDQNVCIDAKTKAVVITRRDRTAVTVLDQDGPIPKVGQLRVMKPHPGKVAGGHARALKLSPARRSEIASAAAKKRWSTKVD